jgi:thiol-disulfide isomerase/thioredoxin
MTQSVDHSGSHAERGNQTVPAEERAGGFLPLLVLVLVAAVVLWMIQARRPEPPSDYAGRELPRMEVAGWLNSSESIAGDDLRGKVVLLDFWHTGCGYCIDQIPDLAKLNDRFKPHGLVMIGLTPEPDEDGGLRRVVSTFDRMDWPIGYGAVKVFDRVGIIGTPTYILYDRTGRSVWGGHSLSGIEDAIVAAMARKGSS